MSEEKIESVPPARTERCERVQGSKGWGPGKIKNGTNTSQVHGQLPARVHRGREVIIEGNHGFEWVRHAPMAKEKRNEPLGDMPEWYHPVAAAVNPEKEG